ncbi:hypothetical protein [Neorhodopirellula lusitana]|uniref:hypothetical protein n=1 Tax=Neorhodopirellula lusitana TaxID=445327 RepID=UPI00384E08BC
MNTRIRRLYTLMFVLTLAFVAISLYGVSLAFTWAKDLPSRVVIDGDALASAFGHAMTESYHHALRDGEPAVQLQVLNEQFTAMIAENDDALAWVRGEYRADILALVDSGDGSVSDAATKLIAILDAEENPS